MAEGAQLAVKRCEGGCNHVDFSEQRFKRTCSRVSQDANGSFHAKGCKEYGTKIVAGVTPGKSGQSVEGIPVFDTVAQARAKHTYRCNDDLCSSGICHGRNLSKPSMRKLR
jgi:hypothetical protein